MAKNNYDRQVRDARSNIKFIGQTGSGGTLLDVGANVGEVALKTVCQFEKIFAIEANKKTFVVCKRRCATESKIKVINTAVTGKTGELAYVSNPSECGTGATVRAIKRCKEREYFKIKTMSLQDAIKKYRPRVIKLDIEGSEYEALATTTDFGGVEFMVVEFHGELSRVKDSVSRLKDFIVVNDQVLTKNNAWTLRTLVFKRKV